VALEPEILLPAALQGKRSQHTQIAPPSGWKEPTSSVIAKNRGRSHHKETPWTAWLFGSGKR